MEFEIVVSCGSTDLPRQLRRLVDEGLDREHATALGRQLMELTEHAIAPGGVWRSSLSRLRRLRADRPGTLAEKLRRCEEYGALPFAVVARAGFIGMQLLNGLTQAGVLTDAERARLLHGLDTVTARLGREFHELDRAAFLSRYGHLRPGTYDILSPRYDEDPDRYFDWAQRSPAPSWPAEFALPARRRARLETLLRGLGYACAPEQLLEFISTSIKERERAKFEYSRSLSDILVDITRWGGTRGLSPADLSFMDIDTIADPPRDRGELAERAARGRDLHRATEDVRLPALLTSAEDVWGFEVLDTTPNFVTLRSASGPVADLERGDDPEGAIVCVSSADPGYDWLFSRGIRGLITAFGGANSHMAIRAQELDVPTVTGVGDQRFARWRRARALEIDCATQQVRVRT